MLGSEIGGAQGTLHQLCLGPDGKEWGGHGTNSKAADSSSSQSKGRGRAPLLSWATLEAAAFIG